MPAKRPETRPGSRHAAKRGAAPATVAGLLLGAAGLILSAAPAASRAESAMESKPSAPASGGPAAPAPSEAGKSAAPVAGARAPAPKSGAPVLEASDSSQVAAPTSAPAPKPASTVVAPARHRPVSAKRGPAAASRPATMPTVRPALGAVAGRPVATGPGVQAIAHLDQKLTYQYNALGRRDPFQPMVGGDFVGADVGGDAPVDVGGMTVVGIVWGTEDKFAMVEDGRGQSLVLRVGDKVMNGVVTGLRRDAVLVKLTTDGQAQTVAIPLTRKGDQSNANR
ncbi:MAG TPA: hypothetical protein VGK89_13355 [Candidatus Eisenbacteria bacterium]|jgi:hypothetical protein